MKYRNTVLVCFALLLTLPAAAQTRKHRWTSGLCDFVGTYDSRRFTARQIRDTVRLALPGEFELNKTNVTVFRFEDIESLDVAALDAEYRVLRAEVAALQIVNVPFWRKLRREKLAEIDRVYQLSRASILSYKQPERLRDVTFAGSCVAEFAEPLIDGGDALLAAWLRVNLDSRARNSDPERLRREYETQSASPNRMRHARVEVTTFGWWNCANEFARPDGREPETTEANVRKLFRSVSTECDEP